MKKVTNYVLMFFMSATVFFVTSCGEDGEILPGTNNSTITGFQVGGADSSSVGGEPGDDVTVSVGYNLDESSEISLIALIDDSTVYGPTPLSSTSINPVQTGFTIPASATEDFVVTYELRDADSDVVSSLDLDVVLDVAVDAEVYEAVLLQAPVGQTPGDRSSKTFFSVTTGEAYTLDEVVNGTDGATSDSIHFGYYYGVTNNASIASPAEYPSNVYNLGADGANWGTLNETLFRPIEGDNFDDYVTSEGVGNLFEVVGGAGETGEVTGLEVGDAFAFSYSEGDETKFGIFQVDAITPGIESTGSITLTVKKPAE